MGQRTLLPDAGEVLLDRLQVYGRNRVVMVLRSTTEGSRCPACDWSSRRRHSWYKRRLSDLTWEGISAGIELHARRFFCDNDGCGEHIFTEWLPETAPRYAHLPPERGAGRDYRGLGWICRMSSGSTVGHSDPRFDVAAAVAPQGIWELRPGAACSGYR